MSIRENKVIDVFRSFVSKHFSKSHCVKIHVSPMHNKGFPDLITIIDGKVVFVEVKGPTNWLTSVQKATLERLKNAGAVAIVLSCNPTNVKILKLYTVDQDLLLEINTENLDRTCLDRFTKVINGANTSVHRR